MNYLLAIYYLCFSVLDFLIRNLLKKRVIVATPIFVAFLIYFIILPDHSGYKNIYENSPHLIEIVSNPFETFQTYGLEPGYLALNAAALSVGVSFDYFRFFIIFLILYVKLLVLSSLSKNFIVSSSAYLAFFLYMDLFILRQSIASTMVAISIATLVSGNQKKATFLLLIAPLFHVVSLLAWPIFILHRLRFKRQIYIFALVCIFVLGYYGWAHVVASTFVQIIGEQSFIGDKLTRYGASHRGESLGVLRGSIMLHFILIMLVVSLIPPRCMDAKYFTILNISVYAFMILTLFSDFAILGDRGYLVVGLPIAILYGYITSIFQPENRYIVSWVLVAAFVSASFVTINSGAISWA